MIIKFIACPIYMKVLYNFAKSNKKKWLFLHVKLSKAKQMNLKRSREKKKKYHPIYDMVNLFLRSFKYENNLTRS